MSLQCGNASTMVAGELVIEEDGNDRVAMAVGVLVVEEDGNDKAAMAAGELVVEEDGNDRATMWESEQGGLAAPKLEPKHTIFLSHSGEDKPFVHQLYADLKAERFFPFFDQRRKSLPIGEEFPERIIEAARTCEVAVVILSEGFLTSKWPMTELITFVDAMKPRLLNKPNPNYNPNLKIVPVFYKTGPNDLEKDLLGNLWNKLVKKLGKNATRLRFDKDKYEEAIGQLLKTNGLKNIHGKNETKYRNEVVKAILQLVPPALPIDTSGIQGCERLCQCIFEMFETKDVERKRKSVQRSYLGLFGRAGVGKTIICCEAMCNFYQEKYPGRVCRVRLDNEKCGEGKFADGQAAATKRRLARLMAVIKQLVGVPKSMSEIMTEHEGKKYLRNQLNNMKQSVFLVVDNVSVTTQDEAKWYVSCEFPTGSYLLVTSRRCDLLENVLGDPRYCKPFPNLDPNEARLLFLSNAASSEKSFVIESEARVLIVDEHLTLEELKVLEDCLQRCCVEHDVDFIPRMLTTFASFLKDKGSILDWKEYVDHADNAIGQEYDALDDTSKLIFLDLAIFAKEMRYTHMDFHTELDWEERNNSRLLKTEFLAMLHDIPIHDAEKKVNDLQHSFLNDSDSLVSEDCLELAMSVITRAGKTKERCMLCLDLDEEMHERLSEVVGDIEYFYDLPNKDSSELVRVCLFGVSFNEDLHNIADWGSVKLLCLESVQNLFTLDVQGLRSLRVLRVIECHELKKIVCTCNSLFTDNQPCYTKNRGCLSKLQVAQLEYLPNLKEASFVMHSRRLETLWFYECPDLNCYPDLSLCRKLKRLRLPCGNFQGFKGLRNNHKLTELAFHWETDTVHNFTEEMRCELLRDIMNLGNLKILDIVDEKEMYDWIPAGFQLDLRNLKFLTFLDLSCSSTIQEVHGLEQLSELTSLGLYGCCELRELPHLGRFRKLRRLCIAHCHNLDFAVGEEDSLENFVEPKPFHALGESCSFGAHECLDVELNNKKDVWEWIYGSREESNREEDLDGEEDMDGEEDSDGEVDTNREEDSDGEVGSNREEDLDGEEDMDGEEDSDGEVDTNEEEDSDGEVDTNGEEDFDGESRQMKDICRQCNPSKWDKEYLATDEGSVQGKCN